MKKVCLSVAVLASVSIVTGCSSTSNLYSKYDENCDVPKTKIVEKIKIVEKPIDRIKEVEKIKYVDRVETKYVDRVKTKYVDRVKNVGTPGSLWQPAVYFDYDKANLKATSNKSLQTNVELMKKYPNLKVNVQGFTDERGSNKYNIQLSTKRMNAVHKYFLANGIAKNRITVAAMGEEMPLLGNTEEGRSINRRVEMMLLDNSGRPIRLNMTPVMK